MKANAALKVLRPASTQSATVPTPLLVNSREAARLLCVSQRTLWTLADTGQIPRLKIGKIVRFDVSDLRAWIAKVKTSDTVSESNGIAQ